MNKNIDLNDETYTYRRSRSKSVSWQAQVRSRESEFTCICLVPCASVRESVSVVRVLISLLREFPTMHFIV